MSDMRIEVNSQDLAELERMPKRANEGVREMLEKITDYALSEVKAAAPVRTGKVRDSFVSRVKHRGSTPEGAIESDWFVARLQEYGYREHYRVTLWGKRIFVPGKPHNPDGYYANPAVQRALEILAENGIEEVVNNL